MLGAKANACAIIFGTSVSPQMVSLFAIKFNFDRNFLSYLMQTERQTDGQTDDVEFNTFPSSFHEAGNNQGWHIGISRYSPYQQNWYIRIGKHYCRYAISVMLHIGKFKLDGIRIEDIILHWNRNWNLTPVSGIRIGIEGARIIPSRVCNICTP